MILDKIEKPNDLKKLNIDEKYELASEIRSMIIDQVVSDGGHLASNLGVVELTIALYSVLNLPFDKVVWDVGHQTYTHKILTGRKDKFNTLRKMGGISGFPKGSESIYDVFDVGHSSTSISAALGIARSRDVLGNCEKVFAVIGDGALTGGMALEALNDAGASDTDVTIILNDNKFSISKNTGGLSRCLSFLRTKRSYINSNNFVKRVISKIPFIGPKIMKFVHFCKNGIKSFVIRDMYFENIGFTYLGPVNGHDIKAMEDIFRRAGNIKGPKLIHVITKKGYGYKPALENPSKYHAFSPSKKVKDYSSVLGKKLVSLAKNDDSVVTITAAMEAGTGLSKFSSLYPSRFFNVEIAEEHAITMASAMAKSGLKPYVAIYSSFLQRAYDQMIHDVAMQRSNVTICVDRAGIVGSDGETHQGIFDLSFLNTIPNMVVCAPKDFKELESMLDFSISYNGPLSIRYPRGGENIKFKKNNKVLLGKSELLKSGSDVTILAIGKMVSYAMEASKLLLKDGIRAEVINARFLKPLDIKSIEKSFSKTKLLVTIEDNVFTTGFGYMVKNNINNYGKIINIGYPEEFISHGTVSEIEKKYGLDVNSIYLRIKREFKDEVK